MTLTAIREQCSRPADGVRFTAVCDAEQRGCLLAVHFYLPHSAAHAAAAALLTDLLTASSADYPEPGMITAQLDSLYAADLTAALTVSGDTEDLSFTATWLDDAYALSGEQITENVAELVLGCLRRPHLSGDSPAAFDGTQYAVCLQNLLDDIEGAVNTRRTYALQQAAALAFAGEPAAVPPAGTREAALALTPQSVYAFWQEILQTAPADVIAVMPQEKPQIGKILRRGAGLILPVRRGQPDGLSARRIERGCRLRFLMEQNRRREIIRIPPLRENAELLADSRLCSGSVLRPDAALDGQGVLGVAERGGNIIAEMRFFAHIRKQQCAAGFGEHGRQEIGGLAIHLPAPEGHDQPALTDRQAFLPANRRYMHTPR